MDRQNVRIAFLPEALRGDAETRVAVREVFYLVREPGQIIPVSWGLWCG